MILARLSTNPQPCLFKINILDSHLRKRVVLAWGWVLVAPLTSTFALLVLTGNAVTMKTMLEAAFPGINVILANHPPPPLKRLLSNVVPVVQVGIMGIVIAGEQIFPRLGIMAPPSWYYLLRANKFRSMASTWLLGNFILSYLQSSGAFEVYCNGELVYSKLIEQRFPNEIELRDLVNKRLSNLRVVRGTGEGFWS